MTNIKFKITPAPHKTKSLVTLSVSNHANTHTHSTHTTQTKRTCINRALGDACIQVKFIRVLIDSKGAIFNIVPTNKVPEFPHLGILILSAA